MKILIYLSVVLLISNIKADPEPEPKPEPKPVPEPKGILDQESEDDLSRVYSNEIPIEDMNSKTIVISGVSRQMAKDHPQNVMQAVVDAVQSQFKKDLANGLIKDSNGNSSDIPEVFFSEPIREINDQMLDRERNSQETQPQVYEKVYKLPVMTRMISRQEETENTVKDNDQIKNNPFWRSPLPIMHKECPHAMAIKPTEKKVKSLKKKGRKNIKTSRSSTNSPIDSKSKPMIMRSLSIKKSEPTFETVPPISPLRAIMMSLIHRQPQPEQQDSNERKIYGPTALLMSISRKTEPEEEVSFRPNLKTRSHLPLIMAMMRSKMDDKQAEQPHIPPVNPFLNLLFKSVMRKPEMTDEKDSDHSSDGKPVGPELSAKPNVNFNFNVNFTINNNYPQSKQSDDNELPFHSIFPFIKN